MTSLDSFKCQKTLKVGGKTYVYYSLPAAEKNGLKGISKLPYSMKVLLENLLRNEDDRSVKKADIIAFSKWLKKRKLEHEISFRPARVLMQDFTGVPAVVDLAAMRNAMQALGGDAEKSRSENTSRPPRTHLTPLPESRILAFQSPLETIGTAAEFVGTAMLQHACRCGGAPRKIL